MDQEKQSLSILVAVVLFFSGCGTHAVRMTDHVDLSPVKRIAVLPFDNLTEEINAGERVTHVFIATLHQARVVQILELGETEQFLIRNRVRSTAQVDLRLLAGMGRELGVDAVLLGIVDEYGYRNMAGVQVPIVGVSLRLLDTRTGKILLAASVSRSGMDSETVFGIGRVRSVAQLTDRVTGQLVQDLTKRFPAKRTIDEEAAWLGTPDESPDQAEKVQPVPFPTPSEQPGEEGLSVEEVEQERSRQNARERSQRWYDEIKRQRRAQPEQ